MGATRCIGGAIDLSVSAVTTVLLSGLITQLVRYGVRMGRTSGFLPLGVFTRGHF